MIDVLAQSQPPKHWAMIALMVAASLVLVASVLIVQRIRAKKRRQEIHQAAQALGFTFDAKGESLPHEARQGIRLYKLGRRPAVRNLMKGTIEDLEVYIFDFLYTTGSGQQRHRNAITAAAFHTPSRAFPSFEIRPENVFHKIASSMGYQDIDLPAHPEFSRKYLLRGSDEAAVRDMLTAEAIEFIEANKGLCIEGVGHWLVVYRTSRRIKPAQISEFLDTAFSVCNRLA